MNRAQRLQALVEELRAAAPSPCSTRRLAEWFSVSPRTIERDAAVLARSGVPVYPVPGPHGGYTVDPTQAQASVPVTAEEAVAIAVALTRLAGQAPQSPGRDPEGRYPFQPAADAVLAKLRARYPGLTGAAHRAAQADSADSYPAGTVGEYFPAVPAIQDALSRERVLEIDYSDRRGSVSHRTVEPIGFVGSQGHWQLLAWCRLRHGVRAFRLDRIRRARPGTEPVRARRDLASLSSPERPRVPA